MTEENGAGGADDKGGDAFKAPSSQAEFDQMVAARLNRERAKFADYEDVKAKAAKFDEVENANKTELQKLTEERDAAARERDELKVSQLKFEVGSTKGLTASQSARLVGTTKAELEADADAFLADLGGKKSAPPDPKKLKSGANGSDEERLSGKDRAAALLREYRGSSH